MEEGMVSTTMVEGVSKQEYGIGILCSRHLADLTVHNGWVSQSVTLSGLYVEIPTYESNDLNYLALNTPQFSPKVFGGSSLYWTTVESPTNLSRFPKPVRQLSVFSMRHNMQLYYYLN
ncbi:hypothetical protein WG66_010778, partial [Moniliophthora roreri]